MGCLEFLVAAGSGDLAGTDGWFCQEERSILYAEDNNKIDIWQPGFLGYPMA